MTPRYLHALYRPLLPTCAFQPDGYWPGDGGAPYGTRQVGLWTFMGVVCTLFALFAVAYVMRIGYEDWRALPAAPWPLWLSTALLVAASAVWQLAARAGRQGRARRTLRLCLLGSVLALAFVGSQLGAWQALAAQRAGIGSGPAAAFFYMLTGLHGLHVVGGLAASSRVTLRLLRRASIASRAVGAGPETLARVAGSLALCARYWHLLLGLWLALFLLLFGVTPEVVRTICSAVGIAPR